MPSDDDRFPSIIFDSTFELDNTKVFTILVDREYQSTEDDYLTRRIRTIEFGDLYDCRNVKVELVNGVKLGGGTSRDTSGKTVEETVLYSYTEKLESGLSKSGLSESGISESGISYKRNVLMSKKPLLRAKQRHLRPQNLQKVKLFT